MGIGRHNWISRHCQAAYALIFLAGLAWGQGNTITIPFNGAPPAGPNQCSFIQLASDIQTNPGKFYFCDGSTGTWTELGTGGAGTVTSVSWVGGIVSIATATTTPAFTIAGTSGGIPYFSSGTTWASSGALTANLPVIGGGAGVAPSVGTRSGNTTAFVTTTGAQTSGDCVSIDANGNHIAAGAACGGAGANSALSNLASVAINTALLPDAAAADDFGSATLPFKDLYFAGSSGTPGTNNFKLTGASTSGTRTVTAADGNSVTVIGDSGAANNFLTAISPTTGVISKAQPAFSNLSGTATVAQLPTSVGKGTWGIVLDGGGSAITTGVKGEIQIPYACTITEWTILLDQSGSIVIDIWKDTYANYPPTVADTITGSAKPTVTTATKNTSTTLTGWTTSVTAGDTIRFNVDSITTATRATLLVYCTKG